MEEAEIKKTIEHYLISVDNTWRHLRQGSVTSALTAAEDARRWHDDLVKLVGPNDPRFEYVGSLIVGVKGGAALAPSAELAATVARPRTGKHGRPLADVAVVMTPNVTAMSYTIGAGGSSPRKISAQIIGQTASLYDGENKVATMAFEDGIGKCKIHRIVRMAFNGLMSRCGHNRRHRENRKGAALAPSAELAATVARQQNDEDLAQRIENA